MYDVARITVEVVSALACFVLVRFMIKPYRLTGEGRYLGLPLGFTFLGISFSISSVSFSTPEHFYVELSWLQLMIRTFAFVFLALTYYFAGKPSENHRSVWNLTLSALIVALVATILILITEPQPTLQAYYASQLYIRFFNVACLAYIAIRALSGFVKTPDPTTIWIPLGFILFAISQYSLIFYYIDNSLAAFTGALALRLIGLAVFLFVAYRTFYGKGKGAG